MPIYHLHVTTGTRPNGASARLKAEYIQREADFERQRDPCIYRESGNMPEWAAERPTGYWEAADLYERQNGRLYKEVEFSLPRELEEHDRIELARAFARELTDEQSLPYTLAVHEGRGEDGRDHNPHAHVMISERMNDGVERGEAQWFRRFNRDDPERGGAEKTAELRDRAWLEATREVWAHEANRALEREGVPERIDHRTLEAQGIDRIAQRHLGERTLALEERGIETERGREFLRIEELNARHERERVLAREYERERGYEHEHERAHSAGAGRTPEPGHDEHQPERDRGRGYGRDY